MRRALLAFALLLSACTGPAAATPLPQTSSPEVSGYYRHYVGEAGCSIHVDQLDDANIELELYCNNGAPSYNSGYLHRELALANNVAVWDSPYGACQLSFVFASEVLTIHQDGEPADCGFGNRVTAHGDFLLTQETPPPMGCMRPDELCVVSLTPTP